jgi:ferredoxin
VCESDEVERIIVPPVVAQQIVNQTNKIYLRKCPCRVSKGLCPTEIWEVCLLFEDAPHDDLLEGRPITQQEAFSILQRMAERKAIHNLFYHHETGAIAELCSCCTCCCEPLHHLKEKGNYAEQQRTGYIAITDESLCNGCGECLDSCYFEARQLNDGAISLLNDRCFGCGRCVGVCPQEAIRLEVQPEQSHPILARIEL